MTAVKQLKAIARDRAGKGAARAARREGQVPAVIYGAGQPPKTISVDFNEAKKLIFAGHFLTTIFEIEVDGEKTRAIPRDYQLDPVKDLPVHIDFLRLSRGQKIKVVVPVHVTGQEASAALKAGAAVEIVEHALTVLAPADEIPESIDVSIANLAMGGSVHLADITLPNGVTAVSRENLTLVTLTTPAGYTAEPAEAAAE